MSLRLDRIQESVNQILSFFMEEPEKTGEEEEKQVRAEVKPVEE